MSELEPSPRVLVPREEARPYQDEDEDTGADFARLAQWLQERWVMVIGVLVIGVQAWWMSALLAHSYFRLDDFYLVERADSNGLSWSYLMWVNAGHLTPVGNLLAWIVTRMSPYNWALISGVTLILLAAAGLSLLRMLRAVFGTQPGILLLLLFYALSPLTFPGLSWWTVAFELLPLEIGLFNAVASHIGYLRTGSRNQLLATLAWLFLCMASSTKGFAVPVLLFAVTSAFGSRGTWRFAAWMVLRAYWRAWALYGAEMAVYLAVYLVQLGTSGQPAGVSVAFGGIFGFAWTLITRTFIPGIFGGPWKWFTSGSYGVANTPPSLAWIAVAVAVLIILVSIALRVRAWRAWAILLGWLIFVDVLPVLAGRGELLPSSFLGQETRYVMEVPGIAALVAGLAFMPLRRSEGAEPGRAAIALPSGRAVTGGLVGLVTVLFIGSVWSFHAYMSGTSSERTRSYLATAKLALAQAPDGTVVINAPVPADVLGGTFLGRSLGQASRADQVLKPLLGQDSTVSFTGSPAGTMDRLMEVDGWGRLVPVAILGSGSQPLRGSRSCWPASKSSGVTVPLDAAPARAQEMRIGYAAGTGGVINVTYAGQTQSVNVTPGLHSAYVPVTGSADTVSITGMNSPQLCVGDVQVGVPLPSSTGTPIPAQAVAG